MSVQAKLIVVGGKASKRTISLQLPTTIGRSKDSALTVSHPQVSRKHCELIETDGLIVVRDSGSLNGTYVGSQRIKQAPLPPGTTFSIGPLTFRVDYQLDGDPGSLPPTIADDRHRATPAKDSKISETLPASGATTSESSDKESSVEESAADNASLDQPPTAESSADDEEDPAFEDFFKDLEGD